MKVSTSDIIESLVERYLSLEACKESVYQSVNTLITCFNQDRKLLVCGNGGSAADCEHIVGELMKAFLLPRYLETEKKEKNSEDVS